MDIQSNYVERIVEDIHKGHIVLPDFQRDFVWRPEDVQDLLVSILADFYIGTMLFMDHDRDDAPFRLRAIRGVPPSVEISSKIRIILDGQQRCSSLYYALRTPGINLRGRKNPYLFYCHIPSAVNKEWENCVHYVNTGNKKALSTIQDDRDYIPFASFISGGKAIIEMFQHIDRAKDLPSVLSIVNDFNRYEIQMVELRRDTTLDRVVEVFERINRTGEPLNITDLLVARLYKDDIQLRDLIETSKEIFEFFDSENEIDPEFVLRLMCLMRDVPIKKKSILELEPKKFEEDWNTACEFLEKAFNRIKRDRDGYGAVNYKKFTPFRTMLIPLAMMLLYVEKNKLSTAPNYRRIDEWYWISVFGNRYNEAVNSTTPQDLEKFKRWVDFNEIPDFVRRFNPYNIDFETTSKSSSTYRGLLNLVILCGASDFKTGADYKAAYHSLQDDHIFPKSIYRDDTVLNKTLITSNSDKSNSPPDKYFGALQTLNGRNRLEELLKTHLIDANGLSALLDADIEEFKKARRTTVVEKIKELTPVASSTWDENDDLNDTER